MYASSREAWCGDSSHSRTSVSCAMSLMRGSGSPVTRSAPSCSGSTWPPASVSAPASFSRSCGSVSGVRTRANPAEFAAMKSLTLMSASSCPRPMTIRWSAVSAISLIRWLETKTVRPSAASDFIRFRTQRMPSGSRPLTGSSNIRMRGSPSSAPAMPSRCPMPIEKPLVFFLATAVSPTVSSTSATRRFGMPLLCARHSRWL